jgi:hypothetical protein
MADSGSFARSVQKRAKSTLFCALDCKVLRLVREKNLMPLMTAISKMTYMPAKFLEYNGVARMANKGRVQVNVDADLTLFDPKTVTDNSTLEKNGLPSTGIPYVVVNGTIVVENPKVLKGVYPGKPIRNPIKKYSGTFEEMRLRLKLRHRSLRMAALAVDVGGSLNPQSGRSIWRGETGCACGSDSGG